MGAAATALIVGAGSVATTPEGRGVLASKANALSVAIGMTRRRPPEPGDVWGGCNDARAAGTVPIYRGEPGYRVGMDGDGDGIACEG
jgi:hypothetical protein